MQGLSKSSITAWLSGARHRVGFDGREGREVSRLCNNMRVLPTSTHVIDRNLELLRAFGIEKPPVRFDLQDTPRDAAAALRVLEETRLFERFALLNPGAGWQSKRWPPDRYAVVARHLGQTQGIGSLVVWAGDEERQWAEQIVAGSGGHARLAPPTSLKELVALARRARAVRRLRQCTVAPGLGGRNAMHRHLRAHRRRAERTLRAAAHRVANHAPPADQSPAAPQRHDSHRSRDHRPSLRRLRSARGPASTRATPGVDGASCGCHC